MAEVRDPIHQFIELSDLEVSVIDTRPVQRLREIHQLSTGYLIWPGATHSRFEHALGTMALAGRAFDAAIRNTQQSNPSLLRNLGWDTELGRARARAYVRLAGLLHDVGHSPFSHGPEHLFPEGTKHEHMTARLILETELSGRLSEDVYTGVVPDAVADIAVGPEYRASIQDDPTLLLAELVTGSVGVDRWDYLLRDSLFSGVRYGLFDVDRLLQSLTLTEFQSAPAWALEAGGQYSAEQMLLARWFMWLNVYTHKTRRILDVHLAEFLAAYLAGGKFPSDVDGYLELTDRVVLGAIRDDDAFRGPLLERGHHRLVREFAASEFENPEGFKSAMAELGADFDAKVDDFSVRPSPPREEDFFVLGTDGQPQSMLEALEIIRPLEPRWFGRVYVPEAKREDAAVALQSLRGGGTPNVN